MNMLYFKLQKSLLLVQNYFVLFNVYSFIRNVFLNKKTIIYFIVEYYLFG